MMHSERPLSFKRASHRQTLYPYPDSPALGEQDRRSMSTTGGALPRREPYRSGLFTLYPQKTGEQLSKPKHDEESDDERDPAQIEAAYLNLVGGGGNRNMSSELSFGLSGAAEAMEGYAISPAVDEARKRSQYFEEQFQYKDARLSSVRERIEKDSPVVAELRTNVIVKDEFTLVTDMSYHLSQRYSRPESSIMINVEHSACLMLAGSFEPAYILTITALPSQLQPVTNKRNSALIQSFMADILSVPPERGILRYQPIAEENLATNGTTIFGEIERIQKISNEQNGEGISAASAIKRAWTKSGRKSVHAKKPTLKNVDEPQTSQPQQNTHAPTTSHSRQPSQVYSQSAISLTSHPGPAFNTHVPTPPVQELPSLKQEEKEGEKDAEDNNDTTTNTNNTTEATTNDIPNTTTINTDDKRKSQLNGILKNVTNTTPYQGSPKLGSSRPVTMGGPPSMKPPPVPASKTQSPKMAKRKSFISIFKR